MSDKPIKRYLFASDFDQTVSFNDLGLVLSELLGIQAQGGGDGRDEPGPAGR